jgi:hypothetical protein
MVRRIHGNSNREPPCCPYTVNGHYELFELKKKPAKMKMTNFPLGKPLFF